MYCPKCGNKLPDGVSTCENCGWSEDAGIQTSKATTKPSPKKVIIAIIAVLVILVAAFGIRMFGSTPAKKDDPAIKICGEWQSKKSPLLLIFVVSVNKKMGVFFSILLMI